MSLELLKKHRFIGILRHIPARCAAEAARAMYEGGVRLFEVTFDPSAPDTIDETCTSIRAIRGALGGGVSVGAGTVLSVEFTRAAAEAGAEFLVSPVTDPAVIAAGKKASLPVIPGAFTPTEIMRAWQLGADAVKIFPVLPDGEAYLKNVISPLSHIPFLVTGGVNPDTVAKFLSLGAVAVAAGATIVTADLAARGDWDRVRENARRHIEKVR